jgi:hypothetical protein
MQKKLTQTDRRKIQQKIWLAIGFTIFAIALFTAIFKFVLPEFSRNDGGFDNVPTYVFGTFGLFFLGVVIYMMSIYVNDLNGGVKDCFEGIVEDKNLNIVQSKSRGTRSGFRGGSRSSSTQTKRYYYITVDGTQHKVEYTMYNNVKVGDTIYFEVAPKSKVVLFYEVLAHAVARTSPKAVHRTKENYPNSKIRKSPLSRVDLDVLRKFFYKKLQYRLSIMLFIGLPIIGLIYNGLWVFVVFLFPLPLIILYQLYKVLRLYFKYQKSVASGRKQLIEAEVRDKVFTTVSNSKGKHAKHTLITSYDSVQVPENIYQKIDTGAEIVIHKAQYLPHVLGITLDENYHSF